MTYAYATFFRAKQQLSQRLYDATNQFWTDAEVGLCIIEALRTWNSLTGFFRAEFILDTISSQTWYDLTSATDCPNTLRPYTVTDTDLYTQIEYHLLEPATGGTWTGSLQFNMDDLQNAIQRRRNEILSDTSCAVTRHLVIANPGRTLLHDSFIDMIRVAWLPVLLPSGFLPIALNQGDEFGLSAYDPDFTTNPPGEPSVYRLSTEPPLSFDVDTPPAVPGQYELLTIDAGSPLAAPTPSYLGVPDDFTWVVKFGAMADLLSRESNAKDDLRAKYCSLRYQQGIALLRTAPAILAARLQNIPMDVEAVRSADNYRSGWQSEAQGEPDTLLIAGLNLIAVAPTPDAGPYSMTIVAVRNAPIPVLNNDMIQIGQDDYDPLLDYAQHLASFKMGGSEFLSTIPLLQRFLTQAALYNSKLSEMGEYQQSMAELSQLQAIFNPVFSANLDPIDADNKGVSV